jgi:hypothetical protein
MRAERGTCDCSVNGRGHSNETPDEIKRKEARRVVHIVEDPGLARVCREKKNVLSVGAQSFHVAFT